MICLVLYFPSTCVSTDSLLCSFVAFGTKKTVKCELEGVFTHQVTSLTDKTTTFVYQTMERQIISYTFIKGPCTTAIVYNYDINFT